MLAREAVAPVEAESARIEALLDERREDETELRQRRQAGDLRGSDAADLFLIAQDVADLQVMLDEANAQVAALRPTPALRQGVEHARQGLVRAQSAAIVRRQLEHVRRLETALVAAVRELGVTTAAHGFMNFASVYAPSEELRRVGYGGRI